MQALAAQLVEGLVRPLLASRGPAAASRAATGALGGADEAAVLHWRLGMGAPVEDALLDCLAFIAGDASAGARGCCTVCMSTFLGMSCLSRSPAWAARLLVSSSTCCRVVCVHQTHLK